MKEIIFRGKRKDNGEWVEGFFGIKGECNSRKEKYCIMQSTLTASAYDTYFTDYDVDPESVGQFTGISDKNGTPIFEGDLLESRISENPEDWKIWRVGFEDGTFTFESVRKSVKSRRKYRHELNMLCIDEVKFYGLVLIGNIYDNPELLNAEGYE